VSGGGWFDGPSWGRIEKIGVRGEMTIATQQTAGGRSEFLTTGRKVHHPKKELKKETLKMKKNKVDSLGGNEATILTIGGEEKTFYILNEC